MKTQDFDKARKDLAADMAARGIGAILWDNTTAGFHFLPVVTSADSVPGEGNLVIEGMYQYKGDVYLIEEGKGNISINNLYNPDTEVKPTVVTLDENDAERILGNPRHNKGYTTDGSMQEWLNVADCYFEALNLAKEN